MEAMSRQPLLRRNFHEVLSRERQKVAMEVWRRKSFVDKFKRYQGIYFKSATAVNTAI